MPHNLTAAGGTTPAYSAGKFAQALSGGILTTTSPLPAVATIGMWVQMTAGDTATHIILGNVAGSNTPYIGAIAGGIAVNFQTSNRLGGGVINDGAQHWCEATNDGTTVKVYVDGLLVDSGSSATYAPNGLDFQGNVFVANWAASGSLTWTGLIDEVCFWSTVQHTGNFTPPTAPTSNSAANLVTVWHLDGDGTDSAGVAATPSLTVSPGTATATDGGSAVAITATLANSTDTLAAALTGSGSLSTTTPTSGTPFNYTPPGSGTGSATVTVTASGPDTLTPQTCVISYAPAGSGLTLNPSTMAASTLQHPIAITGATGTVTLSGGTGASLVTTTIGGTTHYYVVPGTASGSLTLTDGTHSGTLTVTGSAPNAFAANNANVAYSGLWTASSAASVNTTSSGSLFEVGWTGDYLDLGLSLVGVTAPPELVVEVDGAYLARVTKSALTTSPTYRITPALTSASSPSVSLAHRARIWVEGVLQGQGPASWANVLGFELPAGKSFLATPACPNRVLFLGDSITASVRALSATDGTPDDQTVMASHVAWPQVACDLLGFKPVVLGIGGANTPGVSAAYQGYYASPPVVPFAAIAVAIGTNGGIAAYQSQYQTFLQRLRSDSPNALIFLVAMPNIGANAGDSAAVDAALAAVGDSLMFKLNYSSGLWNQSAGADTADGVHPNLGGHARMGSRLASDMAAQLATSGYRVQPAGSGSSTDPGTGNVRSGTTYTINGTSHTGTYMGNFTGSIFLTSEASP